jgi:hypothetical protein
MLFVVHSTIFRILRNKIVKERRFGDTSMKKVFVILYFFVIDSVVVVVVVVDRLDQLA